MCFIFSLVASLRLVFLVVEGVSASAFKYPPRSAEMQLELEIDLLVLTPEQAQAGMSKLAALACPATT